MFFYSQDKLLNFLRKIILINHGGIKKFEIQKKFLYANVNALKMIQLSKVWEDSFELTL